MLEMLLCEEKSVCYQAMLKLLNLNRTAHFVSEMGWKVLDTIVGLWFGTG